ncbi:MAG: hypothetical protein M1824_003320 [Vezdaea acicularis]|nr:MAG: hypothetical protein M1824_003320 [Vezdaea acicularis]
MPILNEFDDDPLLQAPLYSEPRNNAPPERLARYTDTLMSDTSPVSSLMDSSTKALPTREMNAAMNDSSVGVSDRVELIRRLKRGESPTWIPNRTLEDYFHNYGNHPQRRSSEAKKLETPSLLPAVEIAESPRCEQPSQAHGVCSPSDIERPRSALHSGDFTQKLQQPQTPQQTSASVNPPYGASVGFSPLTGLARPQEETDDRYPFEALRVRHEPTRPRALSRLSFSSGIILQPPTSPLAQTSTNTELESTPLVEPLDITSITRGSRRHTLPPRSFSALQPSGVGEVDSLPFYERHMPMVRRQSSMPYQAHQPQRSITSNSGLNIVSPSGSSCIRPGRLSFSSDASPIQLASMVGSYEESILRGRMSTTPSKPLNFMAQIGVLGLGKCKPNLKCPAHVTVPFPAVFYSYSSAGGGRSLAEDGPSPYVGLIDLENSLPHPKDLRGEKRRRRHVSPSSGSTEMPGVDFVQESGKNNNEVDRRKREKRIRRSLSPRAPPGGSYRIPAKGQLQIIIKNPNKTAVKLFLVPYDLTNMEAGTKTFIRQRSYSTGPVVDMPLGAATASVSSSISGSAYPEDVQGTSLDRPTLRYLIHLHVCSPSRGRHYLYKSIRVVFANRVPDGKESLRNEIQLPEPLYSTWKPSRDPSLSSNNMLTSEKGFRRRSSGFGFGTPGSYSTRNGMVSRSLFEQGSESGTLEHFREAVPALPTAAVPTSLQELKLRKRARSLHNGHADGEAMDLDYATAYNYDTPTRAPLSLSSDGQFSPLPTRPATSSFATTGPGSEDSVTSRAAAGAFDADGGMGMERVESFEKLKKGEVGFGGLPYEYLISGRGGGDGLLARRLKGMEVEEGS